MKTAAAKHKGIIGKAVTLLLMFGEKREYCYWCGQKLHNCEKCGGRGAYNHYPCAGCSGAGMVCITHNKLWN